ncbi:AraC family transcriptional regulator ligand-binding domain-containing protein [Ectothiorhodospiraceae bacterium WFHF3C12]|nr:AraC family transcriptional regulator ligand-binding domain-containing protein [Ectothiorhodospiraceae bacterium WFHF3C12]
MDKNSKVVPLQLHPMGLIEAFTRLGADPDELLAGTDISRGQLERGSGYISYAQQARLVRNGIHACDRPGLGLLAGLEFGWCFFGPVGYVAHCSPSLRDAGEAFRRYLAISQPYYALVPRTARPTTVLETSDWFVDNIVTLPGLDDMPEIREFELEFRLATYLRAVDLCGNKRVEDPSVHVRLGYPEPDHGHIYSALPCTSITFDCPSTQIAMHRDFLLAPWRPYRRAAFEQVVARCEEILRNSRLRGSYTDRVRAHVYEAFNRTVTLEEVAERLSVTPRALGRRLADEGTTFRTVVHEVRMKLTLEHLRCSRMSVDEIAEVMGFSCGSSLRRAVKRWSGSTAGEIRAESASVRRQAPPVPCTARGAPDPATSAGSVQRNSG